MTDGLTMTSEGRPDLKEAGDRKHLPSFGPAILQTGLVVAACALFVIAKSIATGGRVHIDDVEYWIVGVVPVALLYGLSLLIARATPEARRDAVARRLIAAWIVTLILFCISKDLHIYEGLRDAVETVAQLGRSAAEAVVALLFAALAAMITMTKLVAEAGDRLRLAIGTLAAIILMTGMASLLLSWH
ncbi:hypothetical protein HL666_26720 [Bradyrhizobium sp. 83002]|uniref:hypothetical protein n=1 Tax=Bradyrhizobium aeschynomenes TaxID=2734909 RepID=UPI0015548DB1|nr:hypothetical protein [Bradyrhizobium aeschynomenes]NPU14368.1 hypothetical protein [Bradyrhizobium aeschynomenes]